MLTIITPETPAHVDAIRSLCWDYRALLFSLGGRASEVAQTYYPEDTYRAVIDSLEELHGPPSGGLRLALKDGSPVGCGMFHTLSPGIAEVKRLYVSPEARGTGCGYRLMTTLIDDCRAAGCHTLYLDTGRPLTQAIRLYESMGFKRRGPYQDVPEDTLDVLVFFEMDL